MLRLGVWCEYVIRGVRVKLRAGEFWRRSCAADEIRAVWEKLVAMGNGNMQRRWRSRRRCLKREWKQKAIKDAHGREKARKDTTRCVLDKQ